MKKNDYAISVLTNRIESLKAEIFCLEKSINEHDSVRTKVSDYSGSYFTSSDVWLLDYLLFKKICNLEEELKEKKNCLNSLLEFVEEYENGKE